MIYKADDFSRIRRFFELTQCEMASICNVSTAYVNMIEKDKRPLTNRVKTRLYSRLNLSDETIETILVASKTLDKLKETIID